MPQLPAVIQALLDPQVYPDTTHGVELVQTQMSFVLLTDDYVYKVKKPVDLDDLKDAYPNLNISHLLVDTSHDPPEDWYVIGVEKK